LTAGANVFLNGFAPAQFQTLRITRGTEFIREGGISGEYLAISRRHREQARLLQMIGVLSWSLAGALSCIAATGPNKRIPINIRPQLPTLASPIIGGGVIGFEYIKMTLEYSLAFQT
jgi:hypothetical protein